MRIINSSHLPTTDALSSTGTLHATDTLRTTDARPAANTLRATDTLSETTAAGWRTAASTGRPRRIAFGVAALASVAVLGLAGCAAADAPATNAEPTTSIASETSAAVNVSDPWVKATGEHMTAAFGLITNTTDHDLVLVGASTPVAGEVELHETLDDGAGSGTMREVEGGFTIPAGGTLLLEPGGNHLMLMAVTEPIMAGDELEFTLEFASGEVVAFTAPAKDYAGANEEYGDSHDHGEHGDHDHNYGHDAHSEHDHGGSEGGH